VQLDLALVATGWQYKRASPLSSSQALMINVAQYITLQVI